MSLPGYILLVIYVIIVGLMLINAGLNLYHAFRFGSSSTVTVLTSGTYLAGIIAILVVSILLLRTVPFGQPWDIVIPTFEIGIPQP